jgi:ABC-type transport system involved in multi-copper enzyme maturation permease subunit
MFGPHFYYDLIRIARKGRTTLLRCLYLIALLAGIWVIYQQPETGHVDRNDYARNAQNIGVTVIVLQYVVVLAVTPVYVCGAIIEEKKRRTLDLLFTTQLSNREIVLGKLGARYAHLAVVLLASLPLLVFVQLWGGIDMEFLVFHYVHVLLALLLACALCMWASAECGNLVEALVLSYALYYGFGYAVAFISLMSAAASGGGLSYGVIYMGMAFFYLGAALFFIWLAVRRVRNLRLAWMTAGRVPERRWRSPAVVGRRPRRIPMHRPPEERRVVRHLSRINVLALPIRGPALFWKEGIKDGDYWSLSYRWLICVGCVMAFLVVCFWCGTATGVHDKGHDLPSTRDIMAFFGYLGAFGLYFVGLAVYAVWSLIRVTGTVVREREQNTLDYLLLLPVERFEILASKWLGSMWRAWPYLAVAYSGVVLGLCCGLYGPLTAVLLVLLPWPLLLMLSLCGLFLSVWCRRVLTANVFMACTLVALFIGHLLLYGEFELLLRVYATLAFGLNTGRFAAGEWERGLGLALIEQASFLWFAGVFGAVAFYLFEYRR